MREPAVARPDELDQVPDLPAVFLLWAGEGRPYLARTALLRRRLKRLLAEGERISRVLNLRGVAERFEYWLTRSQIESALIHLELAQKYFPDDWPRITRLRPPVFVRLTLDNPFPRTMITTRVGKGLFYGPFSSRAAAERFETGALDLFQVRRCEENLAPSPQHPGCIYGEMNRCLRPCQQAVTREEYRAEAARLEQFLRTSGASLKETTEAARDRLSAEMQFEEAERLHQRLMRIGEVQALSGELARSLERLHGVAVTRSIELDSIELWFFMGGHWQEPRRVNLSESASAGTSLDRRLREIMSGVELAGEPNLSSDSAHNAARRGGESGILVSAPSRAGRCALEHLAILARWHGSSWRDGEWIGFDDLSKIPYRKLVNAVSRVGRAVMPALVS
jgi:excinuclease ABC subunit C